MCNHKSISPIVEKDEEGNQMVYSTVCNNCMRLFAISPMTLEEYWSQHR